MICYPASSSILSADEIEYISGGSSGTGAVFSLVGAVFSVINAINVVNIKHDLREKNPDKDNVALTRDAYNAYMEKPYGRLKMVRSVVLLVALLCKSQFLPSLPPLELSRGEILCVRCVFLGYR